MIREFTDSTFQSDVLDSKQVVLIDLWAEWCGPCKMMNPIIQALSDEFEGRAVIGKLNVDDNPEIPMNYNVRGIPTYLLFKNGELKDKLVGMQHKQFLLDKIDAHLQTT